MVAGGSFAGPVPARAVDRHVERGIAWVIFGGFADGWCSFSLRFHQFRRQGSYQKKGCFVPSLNRQAIGAGVVFWTIAFDLRGLPGCWKRVSVRWAPAADSPDQGAIATTLRVLIGKRDADANLRKMRRKEITMRADSWRTAGRLLHS